VEKVIDLVAGDVNPVAETDVLHIAVIYQLPDGRLGRAAVTDPAQHVELPGSDGPWHGLHPGLPVGARWAQERGELVALPGRQRRRVINNPPDVLFPAEARWWRLADTVRGIGAPDGAVGIGHDGHPSAQHAAERGLRLGRLAGQVGEPGVDLLAGDDPARA